jgi:pimeloyl-ACP methyl ester carboxylesterase
MFESRFITTSDGLKLHIRDYGDRLTSRLPVVCLPGLTRTVEDFHVLACALGSDKSAPRRVVALDYRGRGLSDYDRNSENYTVPVELDDVIALLAAIEAAPAVIVATSRGGLIAMALAVKQPGAIAGLVLNDIGPVIEPKGLFRIKGYVGKLPEPRNFEEGAEILRRLSNVQFPKLEAADWLDAAKRHWREQKGKLVTTYDPALARILEPISPDRPLPSLWPQFDALSRIPLLVFRGANSDILSEETVGAMLDRHPGMDAFEVPDEGHAPLLADPATIAKVAGFARSCDAAQGRAGAGTYTPEPDPGAPSASAVGFHLAR